MGQPIAFQSATTAANHCQRWLVNLERNPGSKRVRERDNNELERLNYTAAMRAADLIPIPLMIQPESLWAK